MFKKVAVVGLFAVSSSLSQAQPNTDYKTIYKTVGKFGEIKYSQFAPESNTKAEVIKMRSDGRPSQPGLFAPIATEPNRVSSNTGNNPTSSNSTSNNLTATKPSDPNAATPSQCQKLRNNLSNLQLGGEVYESKSDGAHRYLTPAEVAVKIESTQKLLAQYCR